MKLLTYRYIFRTKPMVDAGTVGIKVVTDIEQAHQDLINSLKADEEILSCYREYCHEIDCSLLSSGETIKSYVDLEGAGKAGIVDIAKEAVVK